MLPFLWEKKSQRASKNQPKSGKIAQSGHNLKTAYFGEIVKHLLQQKVAQNVDISLGKNIPTSFQKPAKFGKKSPNLVTLHLP
jgi:hypothetical protein